MVPGSRGFLSSSSRQRMSIISLSRVPTPVELIVTSASAWDIALIYTQSLCVYWIQNGNKQTIWRTIINRHDVCDCSPVGFKVLMFGHLRSQLQNQRKPFINAHWFGFSLMWHIQLTTWLVTSAAWCKKAVNLLNILMTFRRAKTAIFDGISGNDQVLVR